MNCRSYTGKVLDIYDSDHKLVALQARLPSKRQRRNIFKSRAPNPKPNLKLLRDDAKKRKEFSKAIFEELDRHPLRDSDDANAIEQLISDALNAAAMYVCPPAENEDPVLVDVWNGGDVSSSWKYSRVRCLFKNKGQASDRTEV